MPKCSVFIAASLDGFIARPDGDVGWLSRPEYASPDPAEDFGYGAFAATVDTLVMGRETFEKVAGFEPWPYEGKRVVVLSGRPLAAAALPPGVSRMAGEPAEVLRVLEAEGSRHVYVHGGVTIRRFLRAGLVDELTVTWIPVLLGAGRPLFGELGAEVELELLGSQAWPNGMVQSRYRVARPAARTPG